MSIITLTTDFGLKDHFVGALKGKIITEHPQAQIIDISHDIDLFNISEASYVVNAAYNSFPKGSVHLIGVDSERTLENKHIALQWNDHFFICADNGILSILTQKIVPQQIVEINIHDRLPEGSSDMDVFVKVACHLAKGGTLSVIGKEITQIKPMSELQPSISQDASSIKGYVVYIDHFGNCVTNISKKLFEQTGKGRNFEIKFGSSAQRFKEIIIRKIHKNYSDFNIPDKFSLKDYEGERLALFNEAGQLEIAIYKSNPSTVGAATSLLGLRYHDLITIQFL
ncbi:SAM-dependent chlorinase/fluorinase [Flavobacterium sp.]|uniref:SAM hydrolase/SAM-dependent halogenase family protein n=1 Tax=Flavobacterium sp. TaxID=239 RepID=UPI0028BE0A49|nr:SAM-dependent chlorinase/fluorinase [Flavobacterium sp.]